MSVVTAGVLLQEVVLIMSPPRRSGAKRLSQPSQSQTSQWKTPGDTEQLHFSVSGTSYLNASCFGSSIVDRCWQLNKVAFEAVTRLSNRFSNWLAILRRAMREDVRRVWLSWMLLQPMTLPGIRVWYWSYFRPSLIDTWSASSSTSSPTAALSFNLAIVPVLSGIPTAHLRSGHSTFKLALQPQLNTNHPIHVLVQSANSFGTQRLRSRRPYHSRSHAAVLASPGFNLLESWRAAWESGKPQAQFSVTPAAVSSRLAQSVPRVSGKH